jgi:tRNA1(Val) A37 N6-methylase TrmN6
MAEDMTEDGFLGGRLLIRQPRHGYRAGGDPVFLAAAVNPRPGSSVLDLTAGVGTVSLCLARRIADITVTGIEAQADLVGMAQDNARLNGLAARCAFIAGDVSTPPGDIGGGRFQMVVTNPPWTESGAGTPPPVASKSMGHMEGEVDLSAWIKAAAGFVENKGMVATIHRADRAHALFAAYAKARLGDIRMIPLHARADRPAIRVIMLGRKGVKSPTQIMPPLILHDETGGFTAAARAVLEQGLALG